MPVRVRRRARIRAATTRPADRMIPAHQRLKPTSTGGRAAPRTSDLGLVDEAELPVAQAGAQACSASSVTPEPRSKRSSANWQRGARYATWPSCIAALAAAAALGAAAMGAGCSETPIDTSRKNSRPGRAKAGCASRRTAAPAHGRRSGRRPARAARTVLAQGAWSLAPLRSVSASRAASARSTSVAEKGRAPVEELKWSTSSSSSEAGVGGAVRAGALPAAALRLGGPVSSSRGLRSSAAVASCCTVRRSRSPARPRRRPSRRARPRSAGGSGVPSKR